MISGIATGGIYALVAIGFVLIYKALEVVNFTQGELIRILSVIEDFFSGSGKGREKFIPESKKKSLERDAYLPARRLVGYDRLLRRWPMGDFAGYNQ